MGDISNFIQNIAKKEEVLQTYAAQVININREANSLHSDQDAYTVEVMRADGAIIKNVRLKASIQDKEQGILAIPKKDSWVLVSVIEGVETRAFISQYAEVERTFVRFKNEDDEYLEIDSSSSVLAMHFKKAKSNDTATVGEETAPEYNSIAKIEFNSLSASGDDPKPNLITSFFDENGNEVSKNTFNGTIQETVLNTVSGEEIKERVKLSITSDGVTSAELLFTDENDEEKQKLTFDEEHTEISLNAGNTLFNLKDEEAKLTITDGYEATISKDLVHFNKGDAYEAIIGDTAAFTKDGLEFILDTKFTIKNTSTSLLAELKALVTEVSKIIVVQGTSPNVGALTTIKTNLDNLLKP